MIESDRRIIVKIQWRLEGLAEFFLWVGIWLVNYDRKMLNSKTHGTMRQNFAPKEGGGVVIFFFYKIIRKIFPEGLILPNPSLCTRHWSNTSHTHTHIQYTIYRGVIWWGGGIAGENDFFPNNFIGLPKYKLPAAILDFIHIKFDIRSKLFPSNFSLFTSSKFVDR